MNKLIPLLVFSVLLLVPVTQNAFAQTSISFDETGTGPPGTLIDNFYQSLGIIFEDTIWSQSPFVQPDMMNTRPGATFPHSINHETELSLPKQGTPIIGKFTQSVNIVEIQAIDVGFNDARIEVYDKDGVLIGFDEYEGATPIGNELDADDTHRLSVAADGICSFHLFQPLSVQDNDGLAFDELEFLQENTGINCMEPSEQIIGGEIIPIETTSLLLAGAQSSFVWLLPVILAGAGLAAYKLRRT